MSWSKDYKKSIDCNNPKGFSQRAHCAGRKKRAKGESTKSKSPFNEMHEIKTHKSVEQIAKKHRLEVSFVKNQLKMGIPIEHEHTGDKDLATDIALQHLDEIPDYYTRLKKMEASAKKEHKNFKDVKEETKSGDEGLHDWFGKSKSSDGKKGWVQLGGKYSGKPCARQPGQTSTPKCGSSKMKRNLSADEEEAARRRKNIQDPNQPEKSGAARPTNVRTEEMDLQEVKDKPGKGSGKKDACYHKVKSRYSVWPSAYASGALVKCRKVGAANWGTKTENTDYSDTDDLDNKQGIATHEKHVKYEKRYCPKCKKEEHRHECKHGPKMWDVYSIPSTLKDMHTTHLHLESNSQEEQRYCPLCDKRETRSECSYGEKAWDKVSVRDHEYSMARSELSTMSNAVKRLQKKVGKGEGNLEAWVQSKITKAADYIDTAADYLDSGEMEESVSFDVKHTSADVRKAQKAKKIANLAQQGIGGEKTTAARMSGISLPSIKKEESIASKITDDILSEKCWTGYKKKGMKTMFGKKYPNCVKAENVTIEDANGNTFAEVIDLIKPEPIKGFKSQVDEATRLQSQTGNIIAITLLWRGKYYGIRMFFPQTRTPSRQEVNDEIQKVYPDARVVSHNVSEFTPGQPLIQAGLRGGSLAKLGPNKNYVKPMGEEVELEESTPTWQRKAGKNPEGGLNKAGIASYRREHPGSKLSLAVTTKPSKLKPGSKSANRRKSFCARMSGMKKRLTSAKTARDPNSRINKSLRKWNCN